MAIPNKILYQPFQTAYPPDIQEQNLQQLCKNAQNFNFSMNRGAQFREDDLYLFVVCVLEQGLVVVLIHSRQHDVHLNK